MQDRDKVIEMVKSFQNAAKDAQTKGDEENQELQYLYLGKIMAYSHCTIQLIKQFNITEEELGN